MRQIWTLYFSYFQHEVFKWQQVLNVILVAWQEPIYIERDCTF